MADQIQVRIEKTEQGQHVARVEHDELAGYGVGETRDEALTRALTGLSSAVRKRDWDTRRQKEASDGAA